MTISTTESTVTHNANGVTTTFAIPFKFERDEDITITRVTIATGDELLITTDYTISGAGDESGGSVTFGGAFSAVYQIRLDRNTRKLQSVDLVDNDGLDAEVVERALDRLTMVTQDMDRNLSSLVVGGSGLSVGNQQDESSLGASPIFSEVVDGVHLLRRVWAQTSTLVVYVMGRQYLVLGMSNLFLAGSSTVGAAATTEENSAYDAAIQTKTNAGQPAIVLSEDGGTANARKWALHHPSAGVMSIGAITDDMSAVSDHLRFTRSGASAAGVVLGVMLDANAKRIGNVGALEFDETAKGTTSGSITFDFSAANCYSITLNGNVTATFTAPAGATTTYIEATQDGTGSRVLTFPAAVKWTAATVAGDKLLSTGASKRDLIVLKWNAAGTAALAQIFKDW